MSASQTRGFGPHPRPLSARRSKTPYQRLLESPDIPETTKARLRAEHERLDPFELKKTIEKKMKNFFTVLGNLNREATKR